MTKIQWTEATWNPIVGCTVATPGCTNCYAMKTAYRMGHNPKTPQYHGLTKKVNGNAVWTGKMNLVESVLTQPLKRKKPTMYFVNSMGDLFHESVPDEWIDRVFAVMALCPQHTFQVLTKRADRMREYLGRFKPVIEPTSRVLAGKHSWEKVVASGPPTPDYITRDGKQARLRDKGTPLFSPKRWPLPNVWLGVSVEDETRADERIPLLLNTPAAVRFVSAEPLLGPVDLAMLPPFTREADRMGIRLDALKQGTPYCVHWVIVGGESGPKARPMHPDWARSLRDQCVEAGVPFFMKQWGEYVSVSMVAGEGEHFKFPDGATVRRVGTKAAGNLIDGGEWQQMPEVPT